MGAAVLAQVYHFGTEFASSGGRHNRRWTGHPIAGAGHANRPEDGAHFASAEPRASRGMGPTVPTIFFLKKRRCSRIF